MALRSILENRKEIRTLEYIKHSGHISDKLLRFYAHDEFIDIVLKAGIDGEEIGAHQVVLCAASNFLLRTCRGLRHIQGKTGILLENVDGRSLRSIVNSIYTGSIQLELDSVYGILVAAKKLEMEYLAEHCCGFISEKINDYNCLRIVTYAEQNGFTDLYESARTFALENFDKIYTSMEFLQLTESQLKQFLTSDDVAEISQETLFHSLVAWVGHDPESREKLTYSVLSIVNYKLLAHNFIVRNKESVLKNNEYSKLIDSWLKWHTEPPVQKLYCVEKQLDSTNMKIRAYDCELNSWSEENWPKPTLLRDYFGITVMNKNVIIAGGIHHTQEIKQVEYLDLEEMQWSQLPPMLVERACPCVIGFNGDLYVVAGIHKGTYTRSAEKFNFASGKWEKIRPLPDDFHPTRIRCGVLNGLLFAYGIDGLQCYDPLSNKWTPKKEEIKRMDNIHFAVVNENFYTYNGIIMQRSDPLTNSWCSVELFDEMGHICQLAAFNNRLIVCEKIGRTYSSGTSELLVKEYDPESNKWKVLTSLAGVDSNFIVYMFPVENNK